VLEGAGGTLKGTQRYLSEKLGPQSSGYQGLLLPTAANAAFWGAAGCSSWAWRLQDGSKSHASLLLLLEKTGFLVWGESAKMALARQGAEDVGANDHMTQPVLSRLL